MLTKADQDLIAGWMQSESAKVMTSVNARIEQLKGEIIQGNEGIVADVKKLLEGLPSAQGGGVTEEQAVKAVAEKLAE